MMRVTLPDELAEALITYAERVGEDPAEAAIRLIRVGIEPNPFDEWLDGNPAYIRLRGEALAARRPKDKD